MACHYCINCPRCRSGCSICRRCACTPEQLDAWLNEQLKSFGPIMGLGHEYLTVAPVVTLENLPTEEEDDQKPETD